MSITYGIHKLTYEKKTKVQIIARLKVTVCRFIGY